MPLTPPSSRNPSRQVRGRALAHAPSGACAGGSSAAASCGPRARGSTSDTSGFVWWKSAWGCWARSQHMYAICEAQNSIRPLRILSLVSVAPVAAVSRTEGTVTHRLTNRLIQLARVCQCVFVRLCLGVSERVVDRVMPFAKCSVEST